MFLNSHGFENISMKCKTGFMILKASRELRKLNKITLTFLTYITVNLINTAFLTYFHIPQILYISNTYKTYEAISTVYEIFHAISITTFQHRSLPSLVKTNFKKFMFHITFQLFFKLKYGKFWLQKLKISIGKKTWHKQIDTCHPFK